MSDEEKVVIKSPFRIAFRSEGDWLTAYFARPDSMEGAIEVGRIKRSAAEQDPKVFDDWQALWSAWVMRAVQEKFGVTPEIITQDAPEHERGSKLQ